MISNRWKIIAAALPIMSAVFGTLAIAQPQPGGLGGFFSAWYGTLAAAPSDAYLALEPTAYWYPSDTLDNVDVVLGIASTNTVNTASTTTNGWEFSGSQYLDMGRPPEIEVGTNLNYTMSYWVKFSATSGGAGIMGKTFTAAGDRWSLHLDGNAPVGPVALLSAATSSTSAKQNTTPTIGVWYHYVGVFERVTSGGIKLYVDGVQVASATYSNTEDITYDGNQDWPFQFGRFGSVAYFKGYLDRAAVWNGRSLTSNEVFQLFEDTKEGRK